MPSTPAKNTAGVELFWSQGPPSPRPPCLHPHQVLNNGLTSGLQVGEVKGGGWGSMRVEENSVLENPQLLFCTMKATVDFVSTSCFFPILPTV